MGNMSIGVSGRSYYELCREGKVFAARAIVTAPVIFSTAAGTGGPLLWNNSGSSDEQVDAVILGVTCAITTVTTVAAALGLTGGSGQASAPGSTTAIDSVANLNIGGASPRCNTYRVGTPSSAGGFFLPLLGLSTGALTVDNELLGFIDIGGLIVVPNGSWVSISASATASTTVAQIGLIWAEIPHE
jgi:hypothetical protein